MPEILDFDITGGFVTVRTDDLKTTAFPASAVWMVRTNVEQPSAEDYSITLQMHGDAQVSFFGSSAMVSALANDLIEQMRFSTERASFPERGVVGEFIDMETWQRVTSLIDNRLLQLTRQHSQLEAEVKTVAEMARNGVGEQNSRLLRLIDQLADLRARMRDVVDAVGQ